MTSGGKPMALGHEVNGGLRVRRSALRRSEWLVRAAVVFCVLYAVVAALTRTDERIPFFGWSLFSEVPTPTGADYSVRLLELDGRRLQPPQYYEDAKLVNDAGLIRATFAMATLGRAAERSPKGPTVQDRLDTFEDVYLGKFEGGRFQVVKRTYDIKDRFDCKCFRSETVLDEYEFG